MGIEVVEGEQGQKTICPRGESRTTMRFRPSGEAALKRRETLISAYTLDREPSISSRTIANASSSLQVNVRIITIHASSSRSRLER